VQDPLYNRYAGIYYNPENPDNLQEFESQQLFLRAGAQHVPGFADSLFEAVIPRVHDQLKRYGSLPRFGSPRFREYSLEMSAATLAWAKSFHIDVDWVLREAFDAGFMGFQYVRKGIDPLEAFGTWRRGADGSARRAFQLPAWDPFMESEKNYIRRANAEWGQAREEHIAARKLELARAGASSVRPRRNTRLGAALHFKWAVLHRCAGMTFEELADLDGEDLEAIRISVSRLLKDLSFELPT
jgi:hypothetical protein